MSIENYTKYCGEFGSASSRCAFVRLRDCRGRELWAVNAHVSTESDEDNTGGHCRDRCKCEDGTRTAKEEGKGYYPVERTSDNSDRLVDLRELTGLIIASTFKMSHRRHQLTWQRSTLSTPEKQRKRKMRILKL
ncbi:hypothetical protein RB195_025175 [Necator americanus]|uniref:Uncharacterized protein n=1 Tax=Necator americanus TaxID=51031 RepID=A0ABR1ERA2_NECAM